MNYNMVFYVLGLVFNFEAVFMIFPGLVALCYDERQFMSFFASSLICLGFGLLLTVKKPKNRSMYSKECFVVVALSWVTLSIFGALPFVFSGTIPSFTDAIFETASGFTTTGASILTEVESLPYCMLFWRTFTHWIGGMGVLVFLLAIIPMSGGENIYLMKAESTGPSVGKLVPKLKTTAGILYILYFILTFLEFIILKIFGMTWFEAITTAFGTAGTGGFGIKNSSFADFMPSIQVIVTIFMILFGVNFNIYYLIICKKFRSAFKSSELRCYFSIIFISIVLISINIYNLYGNVLKVINLAAFQVGSIITTTGYASCDFNQWPAVSKTILVMLMFVGASAGSTGGGIKVSRFIILFKTIIKELKVIINPKTVKIIKFDGEPVQHEVVRSVNVYMMLYILVFATSVFLISFDNFDLTTNFTAVAATLNNIGPGLSLVGPTGSFAGFSIFSKIVMIIDMIAGRLELFPMFVLFLPTTWKK